LLASAALGCGGGHHHAEHGGAHDANHRFEDPEVWTKEFDDPEREAWQKPDEVVALMAIEPGMAVVDLGAGTGYFLPYLSSAVGPTGAVVGLDIEPKMVDFMVARAAKLGLANTTAQVVPADGPGLAAHSVDRILIVDTWHHLPEREVYTPKLAAALKEGGQLVIVDFTPESERGPSHKLAAEDVVAELVAAGMEAVVLEETLPDQYIVVAH